MLEYCETFHWTTNQFMDTPINHLNAMGEAAERRKYKKQDKQLSAFGSGGAKKKSRMR